MNEKTTTSEAVSITPTAEAEPLDGHPNSEAEKLLLRKCDLHVVPVLTFLFLLAFIDRINIGNARLQGLEEDLNMTGRDYNIALLIFFIPYILCELPSNLILKKVAPSTWISGIIAAWGQYFITNENRSECNIISLTGRIGVVTICQGVTTSFAGLVVCRFFLGMFEAGFFPGCVYLISMYYRRHELQKRVNFFFSASIIAGAFSGVDANGVGKLLAYGIARLDGKAGYGGWRWIFIIEGLVTVVFALLSKLLIVDWPETAKFLTDEERKLLIARLALDNKGAQMNRLDRPALKRCLFDIKIYLGMVMYFGAVTSGYATAFFTPTILHQFGWEPLKAQVMSIPIFVVSTVITLALAWVSDALRHRFTFTILGCLIATVGYVLLICQQHVPVGARYFAVFAITIGTFITQPICVTWLNNCMAGHYKRSFSTSFQVAFGNFGGVVASNVFLDSEKPLYPTGFGTTLGAFWLCGISCVVLLFVLIRENRIRDAGGRDYRFQLPEDELNNLGDDHPSFRFSY
ncbi:conserved hypothetical protein [Microsporum canis CBS 113480]|uniref:High-affinity nicotinic acid transporter n=1 Tax=Arthroderma otae (strain ATCC MYA-4605 / CBS 113480) TaxID=554155 RepID=C5FJY3_ARTOC|nr:conserved hypothetical protein [Microsporum canis CBS 113480]EEQ30994.1 conserved hypothetical protein [Microsporum canis CBS 113480]